MTPGGGPLLSATLRKNTEYVKCIVAYYARLDMRGVKEAEQILDKEAVIEFSPAAALEEAGSSTIPIYLARAGKDKPDLNQGIDKFIEIALSRNVSFDLSNHEHGRHAFDILDNIPRSKEIIRRTLEFVRFNLSAGKKEGIYFT